MPIIFISEGEDFPAILERIKMAARERGVEDSAIQVSEVDQPGAYRLSLTIEELEQLLALFKSLTKESLSEETFCIVLKLLLISKLKTIESFVGIFTAPWHNALPPKSLITFLSALNASSECINLVISQLFNQPHFHECIMQNHDWLLAQNPELMARTEIQMLITKYSHQRSLAASRLTTEATQASYTLSLRDLPEFIKGSYPGVTDLTLTPFHNVRVELNTDIIIKLKASCPQLNQIRTNSPFVTTEALKYLELHNISLIVPDENITTLISVSVPDDPFATMLEFSRDPERLPVLLQSYTNPALFSVILVENKKFLKHFFEVCSSDEENFESVFLYWSLTSEGRDFILKLLGNTSDLGNYEAFLDKFRNSESFIPALTAPFWREGRLISPLHGISVSIKLLNTLFHHKFFTPEQKDFLAKLIFSDNGLEILNNIHSFLPKTDDERGQKSQVLMFINELMPYKPQYPPMTFETCLFDPVKLCIRKDIPKWREEFSKNPTEWTKIKSSSFFRRSLLMDNHPLPSVLSCWLKNDNMRDWVDTELLPLLAENEINSLVAWLFGKYDEDWSNLNALFYKKELEKITPGFKSTIAKCITSQNVRIFLPLLFKLYRRGNNSSCLLNDLVKHPDQEFLSHLFSPNNLEHLEAYCTQVSQNCSRVSTKPQYSDFLTSLRSPILFSTFIDLKSKFGSKFVDMVLPLYVNQLLAFLLTITVTDTKSGRFNRESERDSWQKLFTSEDFITVYNQLTFEEGEDYQPFFEYCHQMLYLSTREEDKRLLRTLFGNESLKAELENKRFRNIQRIRQLKVFCNSVRKPVSDAVDEGAAEQVQHNVTLAKSAPVEAPAPVTKPALVIKKEHKKSLSAKQPINVDENIIRFFEQLRDTISAEGLPVIDPLMIDSLLSFLGAEQKPQRNKLKSLLTVEPPLQHEHLYHLVTLMLINSKHLNFEAMPSELSPNFCLDVKTLHPRLFRLLTDELLTHYVAQETLIPECVSKVFFARVINLEDKDFLNRIISAQPKEAFEGENQYAWVRSKLKESGAKPKQENKVMNSFLGSCTLPTVTRSHQPIKESPLLPESLASISYQNQPAIVLVTNTEFDRSHLISKLREFNLHDLLLELLNEKEAVVALVGSQATRYSSDGKFNGERDFDLEIIFPECKLIGEEKIRKPHDVLLKIASRLPLLTAISIQAQGEADGYFWVSAKAKFGKIPVDFRFVFTLLDLESAINATRSARVISKAACFIDVTNNRLYGDNNCISLMKPITSLTSLNVGYILSICYLNEQCEIEPTLQLLLKLILNLPQHAALRDQLKPICLELVSKKTQDGHLTAEMIFVKVTEIVKNKTQTSRGPRMFDSRGFDPRHRNSSTGINPQDPAFPGFK